MTSSPSNTSSNAKTRILSSGCNPSDTPLMRAYDPVSGAVESIDVPFHIFTHILAVDERDLSLFPAPVVDARIRSRTEGLQITTRLGRQIQLCPSDQLYSIAGWCDASSLDIGTRVATPRFLPSSANVQLFNHEVRLIAYAISDGSTIGSFELTSALPEAERDIEEIAGAFNLFIRTVTRPGSKAKQFIVGKRPEHSRALRNSVATALLKARDDAGIRHADWADGAGVSAATLSAWCHSEATPSRDQLERLARVVGIRVELLCPDYAAAAARQSPITAFLERLGLQGKRAVEKFVPDPVFCLPPEQLTLFLMVLFSCDGSVFANAQGTPGLSYSTISRRLAEDVQHLLLRYGIITRIRTKPMDQVRTGYVAYEVVGSGLPLVRQFLQQIGIYGRDAAKARISAMRPPRLSSTHRDTVPLPDWFWRHLLEASGEPTIASAARRAGIVLHPERQDGPLTRSTLHAIATTYPTPELRRLADNDLFWDEIVGIDRVPAATMLCLPVSEEADNIVINDIIVRPA